MEKPGSIDYEQNIPAEQPPSSHEARIPHPHAYTLRSRPDQPSSQQRTQVSLSLIPVPIQYSVERLRSHRDFMAVLKHRNKVTSRDLVVHYYAYLQSDEHGETPVTQRRLGLAVSKNVGNAVTRNRVKRRFRQLAKAYESMLPERCDIVMRAKPRADKASFDGLSAQVGSLFNEIEHRTQRSARDRVPRDANSQGLNR
jgi:ribonuclease P protein component